MKLISWNVNGLRACLNKGFLESMTKVNPDVICLQEIKMMKGQAEIDLPDYYEYWNSAEKKGYSGTAVFSKTEPIHVQFGMGIAAHDTEGRLITLEYDQFYLVNCYTPNVKRELTRLPYRMEWEDDFRKYLKELEKKKPVVLCGDLNVAHQDIDIKNYRSNHGNAGFTAEERGKLTELLASGFVDSFRYFYPKQQDAYSWWSYMAGVRERNVGWRIDYFIVSESFLEHVQDAKIHQDIWGSDHCPVELLLK